MNNKDTPTTTIALNAREFEILTMALDLLIASLAREHTKLMKIGRRHSAEVVITEQAEIRSLALKVRT